jgi:outer membrane protein, heavy metal efflux system
MKNRECAKASRDFMRPCLLVLSLFFLLTSRSAIASESCQAITRSNVAACAVAASYALQREQEAGHASEGRVEAARPWLPSNPQVSAGVAFRNATPTETSATNWSLGLSQELQVSGRSSLRTTAAEGELTAQKWRTLATARDVAQRAWLAYYDVLFAEQELTLAARIERAGELLSASTRARAEKGLVSLVDAEVTDALQAKYAAARIQADARVKVSRAVLTAQMGFDASTQPVRVQGELAPLSNVASEAHALLTANDARPDVKALLADSTSFEAQSQLYRRQRVPNVTLSLNFQNDGLFGQKTLGLGVSIPVPILQPLGRTYSGEILEFEALAKRSRLDASRLQREVRLAIVSALLIYDARVLELGVYKAERVARAEASIGELAKEVEGGRLAIQAALVSVQALTEFLRGHLQAQLALCASSIDVARAAGIALERESL